jgi:uncharacterized protein involved in exopolysaccharide biosynthesis
MSEFDRMVVHLGKELSIKAVPRSSLIRISYRSKDPVQATSIVKTLTERYVERRVERNQSSQVMSFFETQMREAEDRLKASEKALKEFSDATGVTMTKGPLGTDSLAAEKNVLMERLAGFQKDLGDAEASLEEQSRRVANLRIQLAAEPERLPSASRNNKGAATDAFEGQLAALQLERDRLLQDFKPDSRYVRDVETQIALVQERLAEAQLDVAGIDGTETNPIHQNLKAGLVETEAQLAGTRGRIESLRGQVADCRRDLETLNVNAFKLEILRRDQQAAEDEYLLYRRKHEEARISEAMDREKLVNVSIAEPAQVPLRPIQRNLMLTLVAAILFGIIGGLGLAFVVEYLLDHTFTTGEEMERRLGLVHLASIPEEL